MPLKATFKSHNEVTEGSVPLANDDVCFRLEIFFEKEKKIAWGIDSFHFPSSRFLSSNNHTLSLPKQQMSSLGELEFEVANSLESKVVAHSFFVVPYTCNEVEFTCPK
jgi:hypothetical protein